MIELNYFIYFFVSERLWVFGREAVKNSLEWVLKVEPSILNVLIEYEQW